MGKPVIAKWRGRCCICDKSWDPGEQIKPDELSNRWGHSRCVNRDMRERASQRRLDENADAANQRRWNTG